MREEILKRFEIGIYLPEGLIPSVAELVQEFQVSPITIERTLADLQSAGLLVEVAGQGTCVRKQTRRLRKMVSSIPLIEGGVNKLASITRERIKDPAMDASSPPTNVGTCERSPGNGTG